MRDDDRQDLMDEDSTPRSEGSGPRTEQTQLIRLLANPRRVRRA